MTAMINVNLGPALSMPQAVTPVSEAILPAYGA
jgi:hypothetical protein